VILDVRKSWSAAARVVVVAVDAGAPVLAGVLDAVVHLLVAELPCNQLQPSIKVTTEQNEYFNSQYGFRP
jgi:hypothetical protein